MSVLDFIPAKLVLQIYFQHRQNLAVHIILGHAKEKNGANHPAKMSKNDTFDGSDGTGIGVPNGIHPR
jgi:hypothetical protein